MGVRAAAEANLAVAAVVVLHRTPIPTRTPDPDPDPEPLAVAIVGLPDVAVAGASYELVADAGDEEGLSYAWRVDGGTIVPDTGRAVIWTAPDAPGVAWIHVDVTGEDGRTAEPLSLSAG